MLVKLPRKEADDVYFGHLPPWDMEVAGSDKGKPFSGSIPEYGNKPGGLRHSERSR